jgi:hypothetical protein
VLSGLCGGMRMEGREDTPVELWLGLFEYELAPWVRRLATPGRVVVDVGSANGYYALACARLTGAPVVAYEVDRPSAELIRRNCAANPEAGRLVDVREAYVAFERNDAQRCVTLDDEVPDAGLLKVDVEGAELWVLSGARRLLSERRPHVIVETHSLELERECGDALLRHGYRPVVVSARRYLRQDRDTEFNRWIVAEGR